MTQRKLSPRPHWHRIQHQTTNNIVEQTLKATIKMPATDYSIFITTPYMFILPNNIETLIHPAMPFCLISTNKTSYCSHFDWEGHAPLVADAGDKSNPRN